jgi:ABC-2 type transport system permease protein
MLILSTVAIVVFTAYFGMLLGLHFPKFDWQNENIAVKQGFAVFGSMFGGMIWAMINAVIVFLLSVFSFILGALVSVMINGVICFIIHRHLTHGGVKKFMTLKQ